MLFFVHYKGKEHKIRVESKNNNIYVAYENEAEKFIDLSFLGNDCTFFSEEGVFHANVVGKNQDYTVWRPEGNLQFVVESEYRRIVGSLRGQELEEENKVYSKMPGKIFKINTKVGSVVDKGDPLLVMEAMKMENEIRSTMAGTVRKITVTEGQAVESGTLLIELEAKAEE